MPIHSGAIQAIYYNCNYIYFSNNINADRGPARAPSPSPEPEPEPAPSGHLFLGPLSGSLLGGNATVARNPYLTRHFSRQNAVYCPFSKKERVFPDWSSLFRLFLGYFQIRNAIFVDFEERHTASVDVWVIFGSFSKEERHDLAKHRASSIIYTYIKL